MAASSGNRKLPFAAEGTLKAPDLLVFSTSMSLSRSALRADAVGGDFDLADTPEREQELYQVLGRLVRGLCHDMANCVGDRGLEHYAFGLQAGEVHAHELARLEHQSYMQILAL
jgi:hypothetical protein